METHSQWHSIRPWRPTLSLSVREITSVSATFILSSPLGADHDSSLASLGFSVSDEDDQNGDFSNDLRIPIIGDLLSKGIAVKVNGTPWQRVLFKIDEEMDEAVIILFGLMPGRQYDIELGVVPGERSIRGQITTGTESAQPTADDPVGPSSELSTQVTLDPSHGSPTAPPPAALTENISPSASHPASPTAPPALTLEDRRQQLTLALNALTAEHATLTATLKTTRRESQKADVAVRSEIEALKRASDRAAAGEQRARQKVLALQESVKQTVAATKELEALREEVEAAIPALTAKKAEVESEWATVKAEAEEVRARKIEVEKTQKRKIEGLQVELATLGNRLEKLGGRREKLEGEGGVIADLEEKLRKLEEERERVESDPYGYEGETDDDGDYSANTSREDRSASDIPDSWNPQHATHRSHHHHHHPHPPHQKTPHSQSHPHATPTPSYYPLSHPLHPSQQLSGRLEPIQRPSPASRMSLPAHLGPGPGVIHLGSHRPHVISSSSSSGSSSVKSTTPAPGLSSRAPPFEPLGLRGPIIKSDLNPGSSPFSPRTGVISAMSPNNGRG